MKKFWSRDKIEEIRIRKEIVYSSPPPSISLMRLQWHALGQNNCCLPFPGKNNSIGKVEWYAATSSSTTSSITSIPTTTRRAAGRERGDRTCTLITRRRGSEGLNFAHLACSVHTFLPAQAARAEGLESPFQSGADLIFVYIIPITGLLWFLLESFGRIMKAPFSFQIPGNLFRLWRNASCHALKDCCHVRERTRPINSRKGY